ncbi:NADH kinase POS5 [Nannizzia gypsea CBS 118893]|uniref:NADH kinase POS5 n=1 Tax=Arthroderma gypseum (strain ATCC MYA-4604 / CBS 118893) TaxID=535722 RepID=E4UU89_ARTGP|nr:NADH kinase POS5 [Nannizzia gypsea CBS 118893]EFR00856.1 NADH kinase POS5 [Nannizzia gypsea CBS 118893]
MKRCTSALAAIASPSPVFRHTFSVSSRLRQIEDVGTLPGRVFPRYEESGGSDLLALQWPGPPRNILLMKKKGAPEVTQSVVEFANHIKSNYAPISVILERDTAAEIHESLPFPVYTNVSEASMPPEKVDLIVTLGGDGTILRASSLFATSKTVPPILSFSMGTLGFLGEWKFSEYKGAFREVYMSGAGVGERAPLLENEGGEEEHTATGGLTTAAGGAGGWSRLRGKSMGTSRSARILVRSRLRVGVFTPEGEAVHSNGVTLTSPKEADTGVYAMNEVVIHRGRQAHLAIVEVFVGGRFLTEAVADGMIVATPTGSTAYSLSCGGSIIHPLVSSLLLTPICARSLSFRSLVVPSRTPVTLRLSEKNRGREVEVSIDGVTMGQGLRVGMEVRVWGEDITVVDGAWHGGVPCVMRKTVGAGGAADGWVGGLNGLLKFNYPFGSES